MTPPATNALQGFLDALETMRRLYPTMPARWQALFVHIALQPGRNISFYASALQEPRNILTQDLQALGPRLRNGAPGLGLILTRPREFDRRHHVVLLTDQGKELARALGAVIPDVEPCSSRAVEIKSEEKLNPPKIPVARLPKNLGF